MQKEDPALPEGTVVDQLPRPGQLIRLNQNVFVTTSTKQPPQATPDWWGKRIKDLAPVLEKNGLEVAVVSLESSYPQGMCIAQIPTAGQPMQGKAVRLYVSVGMPQLAIMPSFNNLTVVALEKLLEHKDVRVEYVHQRAPEDGHSCQQCIITDQHPVAGAIVDTSKTVDLQLQLLNYEHSRVPGNQLVAVIENATTPQDGVLGGMPLAVDVPELPNTASQA